MNHPATLDDLMRTEGRAELIGGRVVRIPPTGYLPAHLSLQIVSSLHSYLPALGVGEVFGSKLAYVLDRPLPSGRQSFSPIASYHAGPFPRDRMKPISGSPTFAIEIRGEYDYGPKPDREYAEKRADYFAAGTLVVWDVDPIAETVTSYAATDPTAPTVFRRGDAADAEPAVPGWRLSVDVLFS